VPAEGYEYFVPSPLPPNPPIHYDDELLGLLSRADLALGRLDGAIRTVPDPDLFVAMYVRQEAVLSSQIEGTQSTLEDLLSVELEHETRSHSDVGEIVNYVAAMDADKHNDLMRAEGDKICGYLNSRSSERIELLGRLGKPKVTRSLERQYPELHRIVAAFDEGQYYLMDDQTIERVGRLAQRARSLNIIIAIAVPSIGKLNSKDFLNPFRIRFALGLGAQWETATLCGDDAQRMGYKPHDPNHTPGTVVVAGDGPLRRFQVAELTESQQQVIGQRGGVVEKLNLRDELSSSTTSDDTTTDFSTTNEGAKPVVDPRLKLLHDVIEVATPTAEQIAADPLCEFVIQTDPLLALLQKSSSEYRTMTSPQLRDRLKGFGLESHQKNYERDGMKSSKRGWWLSEINNIIEGENNA